MHADPGNAILAPMLTATLLLALLAVLVLILVRRTHLSLLATVASLIGACLILIWLQETGLWPGTSGPLTPMRPPVGMVQER